MALVMENTMDSQGGHSTSMKRQLWKLNDQKSYKDGSHSTIYWVGKKEREEDGSFAGAHKEGASYQGEWRADRKSGYGIQTYPNGNKYEGNWENGTRCGEGVLWIRPQGQKKLRKLYIGGWLNDKRHGKGTCFYKNGEYYQGDWVNGRRHGQGQMRTANGDLYLGAWHDDQRSGYGTLNRANGDSYEGYWLRDKREGSGSYFYAASGKVFVGEWVDDLPKAGVYTQSQENPDQALTVPVTTLLPKVRLVNPAGVLEDALARVRADRTAFRAAHTPIENLFSEEELADLRNAFASSQQPDGTISAVLDLQALYKGLGIHIGDPELKDLLLSVGLEPAKPLTFQDFARTIALVLDQEVADPQFMQDSTEGVDSMQQGEEFF